MQPAVAASGVHREVDAPVEQRRTSQVLSLQGVVDHLQYLGKRPVYLGADLPRAFFAAELLGVLDHRGFRFAHQGAELLVDEVVLLSQ